MALFKSYNTVKVNSLPWILSYFWYSVIFARWDLSFVIMYQTEFLNVLGSCLRLHLCSFLHVKTVVISWNYSSHLEFQVHFSVSLGCVTLWYQNDFEGFCKYLAFCSRNWEESTPSVSLSSLQSFWFLDSLFQHDFNFLLCLFFPWEINLSSDMCSLSSLLNLWGKELMLFVVVAIPPANKLYFLLL